MSPTAERWFRMETIFHETVTTTEPERTAILVARCAGDTELMAELRALLDACASEEAQHADSKTWTEVDAGQRVGPYAIDGLLGRGGMGAVYLAHRADGQFEQKVAVKIIDMPLATELFRERFRTERQILAGLSHPYIARLLDGGVSEAGELYLAMEYVDGPSITQFCEKSQLGIPERLRLFQKVCEAVQYAHQNLIVHRDLKPDNILVVADGTPRLLDFGTAKIVSQSAADAGNDLTRQGLQTFTPRYASPEQVLGQAISIASDTYSLGVLLFVLLTNGAPYELKEFTTEEMVRVICGQEPRRPSGVGSPIGRIDSDLDSIVLKALRKEPAQRYSTVEQFSADVQSYLDQRPVLARRGDLRYRAGKFIRRNRLALAGSTLLVASLIAGVAGIAWQARVANRQRQRAEARSADLRQLSNSLLSEIDEAIKGLPGSTPVQKLLVSRVLEHLDRAAQDSAGEPLTQLDLMNAYTSLGNLQGNPYHQNIGDPKGALQSLEKAVSFATALNASRSTDRAVLRAYGFMEQSRSEVLYALGRDRDSVQVLKAGLHAFDTLAASPTATKEELADAGAAYNALGDQLNRSGDDSPDDPEGSVAAYRKDIVLIERSLRLDPNYLRGRRALALIASKIGADITDVDPVSAVAECRRSLATWDALPEAVRAQMNIRRIQAFSDQDLGVALMQELDFQAAIHAFEDAVSILAPYAKADPKDTRAVAELAEVLRSEGWAYFGMLRPNLNPNRQHDREYRQAGVAILRRSLTLSEQLVALAPENTTWLALDADVKIALGTLLYDTPQREEGLRLASRAVAMFRKEADKADAPLIILSPAVATSLLVLPRQLRDPVWTLHTAERLTTQTRRKSPGYLLMLAHAANNSGEYAVAKTAAQDGLRLLPAQAPGTPEVYNRRMLTLQLERSETGAKGILSPFPDPF